MSGGQLDSFSDSRRAGLDPAPAFGLCQDRCTDGKALDRYHEDSVLATMGAAQRVDPYLAGGHYIEAMYFPMPDATDSADLTDRKMTPVILQDGKVLAGGGNSGFDCADQEAQGGGAVRGQDAKTL
jgi:hypothetical protein